ncbi:podocalyxin isoform X2 [Colius striatus]|uniref:podocalyxin isoform X2 n=1 Tax=Colius striatus TaxID=57412 RepID=UPI002B1DDE26|nr:podocalyxin isoform X2 [Colius striatus]
MRAALLLPLLLLGVSSQDAASPAPAVPEENRQEATAGDISKTQETTPTSNPGNQPPASTVSPTTEQRIGSTGAPANPSPTPAVSPTTAPGTSPTNKPENPTSPPAVSPTTVQMVTTSSNPGNPPPAPVTPSKPSQQVSSSTGSRAPAASTAAIPSTAQQTGPMASSGTSAAITPASPILHHVSSPSATPGHPGTAVASPTSVEAQRRQPSDQLTTTTIASSSVPRSSLPTETKDHAVSSSTKQPHASSSSPAWPLASSTRPRSIDTSVSPFDGSVSHTTSKASLSSPPSSTHKVSEAATTAADQRSHEVGSVSTKRPSAEQSPASAQPSAPAPGEQTASPGPQHPSAPLLNEVICKDQEQNHWPTITLKEARTCAEWRSASSNISFFESFCSTGQHVFNSSRERCTVLLSARQPRARHWALQPVLHLPLDPEKVLEELKEKDKLEELGIANITYDKLEREMVITDEFSTPLIITIITLAGSLLLIAAIYGCCHQRFSQKKDQHIHPDLPGFDDGHVALIFNRLTEELQTMENGYHDNPTLEVMETSSEMQEKKVNLNGELGDSWIVPLDTLMKEDLEEEEDTHL